MARTVTQIYDQITATMVTEYAKAGVVLPDPATWSIYSPRRLTCFIVATCIWTLEALFDELKSVVNALIADRKTHTAGWYVNKAKDYQHGYSLVTDTDYYDNTGLTEQQIEDSQVVKYAAATEVYDVNENLKGIRLKLATIDNGDLSPLSTTQFDAFKAYFQRVKDAGVKVYYTNGSADSLKLTLDVYYDPLVLDSTGKRLDGTDDTPVANAIDAFLKEGLDFNGLFITSELVDELQKVDGVKIPHISSIQARYGELAYADIPVKYQPDSGYLRILDPGDLVVNYIAQ